MNRALKWTAWILLTLVLIIVLFVLLFDWNWLRQPIMHRVTEETGRQLVIKGDLNVRLGWPLFRVRASNVTFANPAWAKQAQMMEVGSMDFSLNMLHLLHRKIALPDVRLNQPVVFLELAPDGRKNWLLDKQQLDENTKIPIGRLTLDQGRIAFDDIREQTSIQAEISTKNIQQGNDNGVVFSAKGRYKNLPLEASGSGGPVLALEDNNLPYPIQIDASIGRTAVKADGRITNLNKLSAVDMNIDLRGDSLVLLYPLLGIALPETPPYTTRGHLLHSGQMWRYEGFSGRMGKSDVAGTLQVDSGGKRPFMHGELNFQKLDFADLGPMIGTRSTEKEEEAVAAEQVTTDKATTENNTDTAKRVEAQQTRIERTKSEQANTELPKDNQPKVKPLVVKKFSTAKAGGRVLPQVPYKAQRWDSVDADVKINAKHIHRAKQLPIDNLVTRLQMRDSVLTLDPLDFGAAGGHLAGSIALDGTQEPIQAHTKMQARKLVLAQMFPTFKLNKASIGHVNGQFDLTGNGDAVAQMLATSNGKLTLIVDGGEVSKLMMEMVNLHLLEILQLKLAGDEVININCGIADFNVKSGVMNTNLLLLDTSVTSLFGSGYVDMKNERLDLTINQKPKKISVLSLRSPIYIRGPFANPEVALDKQRMATRGLGALALGVLNPLLALLPLFDPNSGFESECNKLLQYEKPRALGAK